MNKLPEEWDSMTMQELKSFLAIALLRMVIGSFSLGVAIGYGIGFYCG